MTEEYKLKLSKMTDYELLKETERTIWLSAYANNNPKSKFHGECDACYDECIARQKVDIYEKAYALVKATC